MDARPIQPGSRCNATKLVEEITVCISPLLSDKPCTSKVRMDQTKKMILVTTTWHTKPWYPQLLEMLIAEETLILSKQMNFLRDRLGNEHPLVMSNNMRLAVWEISAKVWHCQAFQRQLPTLSSGECQLRQVMNRLGKSGLAGVVVRELIYFCVI